MYCYLSLFYDLYIRRLTLSTYGRRVTVRDVSVHHWEIDNRRGVNALHANGAVVLDLGDATELTQGWNNGLIPDPVTGDRFTG
jgi:hypothetical protein